MQRLPDDLPAAGATLAAGVTGGFVCGVLIGGVGGRLAMLLLRLTSDPALRGVTTDDGFTIGRVSSETIFLLGVTTGLGMVGGVLYLVVRGWIPPRLRVASMTAFFGLVGGAGLISPHGLDFNALGPLPLAVALFVAIPAAYGAAMPWLTERLLREDSAIRRRPWGWIAGLLPLVLANVVGLVVLVVAWVVWTVGRTAPGVVAAWRSRATIWVGRAALVVATVLGGAGLVRDGLDILA
ncbi:MAG: hypothetical protein ACM3OO_01500 [Planctomycetaceae bacterium]